MAVRSAHKVKHLAATATVTTANAAGILYSVSIFSGNVDGKVILTNGGSGGALTLTVGQSVANQSTQWRSDAGIIFTTDIYATISGTGTESVTFEYDELE